MTTKKTAAADHASLVRMLRDEDFASLAARAYAFKTEVWGKRVALRGLVEVSNVCARNCLYCGIRRGNAKTVRYRMSEDEVFAAVAWAAENRYGSVVLQSGEVADEANAHFFERVLRRIRKKSTRPHTTASGRCAVIRMHFSHGTLRSSLTSVKRIGAKIKPQSS